MNGNEQLGLIVIIEEEARSENQQEKRKSAGQVLPVTVLHSHMSKKRKSAGQVLIAYYRFAY